MVGKKSTLFPVKTALKRTPEATMLREFFLSKSKKRTCRFELPAIQRNSCRTALHQSWTSLILKRICVRKTANRDSIRSKVFGKGGMGFGEGRESFSSEKFSLPSPMLLSPSYFTTSLRSWGCRGRRQHPCRKRDQPWSNCKCGGSGSHGAHRPWRGRCCRKGLPAARAS